jgi:hypothetical protein
MHKILTIIYIKNHSNEILINLLQKSNKKVDQIELKFADYKPKYSYYSSNTSIKPYRKN